MTISEEYRDMYVISVEMDDKIYIIGSISNGSPNFAGFKGSSDYRKFVKKIREVSLQGLDKIYTLPYSGSPRLHLMDSLDDSILSEYVNILTAEYRDIMSISYIECSGKYARTWRESGTPISFKQKKKNGDEVLSGIEDYYNPFTSIRLKLSTPLICCFSKSIH